MKLRIQVKPQSKHERIETKENGLVVFVTEPPIEGRANRAVIELLARHFGVPRSAIIIDAGTRSRRKWVDIRI